MPRILSFRDVLADRETRVLQRDDDLLTVIYLNPKHVVPLQIARPNDSVQWVVPEVRKSSRFFASG